jgi:hypothetical protein
MKKVYKYKLTDQNMQSYDGFKWELNKWYEVSGEGELCSEGWLHFYDHPLLAVLHNPIHAQITNPLLFKAEVTGNNLDDDGIKCGWQKAMLVKQLPIPKVTTTNRIAYGILCAKEVYYGRDWLEWANNWLSGVDRIKRVVVVYAATYAAYAAAAATAATATAAADANATYAYAAATYAAAAADADANATDADANATYAYAAYAYAAAKAATYAAAAADANATNAAANKINFTAIAKLAMTYK